MSTPPRRCAHGPYPRRCSRRHRSGQAKGLDAAGQWARPPSTLRSRFEQTTAEAYDELFAVNAKGPYFTGQRLAPVLAEGSGVVFTTSVANVRGLPMSSVYAASKAALRSMTRSLARELLDRKIRVNAVSPGPINTGILRRSMPADVAERLEEECVDRNPMGRMGEPLEVARAVLFLAFDATSTTGAELTIDGGASQL